ncbi:MAG: site-2 protease family protein [Eubacteriaceae bacterium]
MRVKINPVFFVVLIFMSIIGEVKDISLFFIILVVHDFAHYLIAKYYDVKIKKIEIMPFGCEMNIDDTYLDDFKKIVVYLAGPFSNILFAVILFFFKYFNIYYFSFYNELVFINICIGIINLIPLYPMDGSMILRIILSKLIGHIKASKIIIVITQICGMFLIAITLYSLVFKIYNINYGLVGLFLIIQSNKEKENILIIALQNEIYKRKKVLSTDKYLRSVRICANNNTKVKKMISNFNANTYYIIDVIDSNYKYNTTITEEDIIEGVMNLGYDCTINDILIK